MDVNKQPPKPKLCESCAFLDGEICRRLPPQRLSVDHTGWPVMRPATDWCGEFRRKPAPPKPKDPKVSAKLSKLL